MFTYLRRGFLRRYIRMNAFRRGLLGGSKPWLAIFVLGMLRRQMGKVTKRGDMPLVLSEALKPGEAMIITHLAPKRRGKGAS
ncbi:MAG TPA: hypothetical protein VM282_15040 [Acidimicrobiales bacterium]|nr:hypothetical protein [Acidimicrobiales bacterium]